ncbi:MAG: O-antigen ligase family protein [Candidatus Brocadiia bacterium]
MNASTPGISATKPDWPGQIARWAVIACIPAALLGYGEHLPLKWQPYHPSYFKYFGVQIFLTIACIASAFSIRRPVLSWTNWRDKLKTVPIFPALLLIYIIWVALGSLRSVWPYGARAYLIRETTFFAICTAAYMAFRKNKSLKLPATVFAGSAILAAIIQSQHVLRSWLAGTGSPRLVAIFRKRPFMYGNVNFAPSIVVCACLITMGVAINHLRKKSQGREKSSGVQKTVLTFSLLVLAILAPVFIFVISDSLAGYIGACIAAGAYLLCLLPIPRKELVASGFVVLALGGMVLLFRAPFTREKAFEKVLQPRTTAWARVVIWSSAFDMVVEKPMMGRGLGGFASEYYRYELPGARESQYMRNTWTVHPHNEYLRVWLELGIFGLLIYLAIPAYVLWKSYRYLSRQSFDRQLFGFALWSSLLSFLVQASFGKSLYTWDFALPFWLLLGILAATTHPERRREEVRSRNQKSRWILGTAAILVIGWAWWQWGYGSYRSMCEVSRVRAYTEGIKKALDRMKRPYDEHPGFPRLHKTLQETEKVVRRAEPRLVRPVEASRRHYHLGAIYKSLGMCRHALAHYRIVDRWTPGALETDRVLGECYLATGNAEKARQHLTAFIRKHPERTDAYVNLAKIDRREAAQLLLRQLRDADGFDHPRRAALAAVLLADLDFSDHLEKLLADINRFGNSKTHKAVAANLRRYFQDNNREERVEELERAFPKIFKETPH